MVLRRILPALLLTAAGALCWFMLVYVPGQTQRERREWWFGYTEAARWRDRESAIRRWGWRHDDFEDVGRFGGKDWAAWIMARMNTQHDLDSCGGGHMANALSMITNHAPPVVGVTPSGGKDRGEWTERASWWRQWWEEHKDETQEQWVRDGFASAGVEVGATPSSEDVEKLLALIGKRSDRPTTFKPKVLNADTLQPEHERFLRLNAMRWLRDSNLDVVGYAVERISPETSGDVKQGVKDYFKMLTEQENQVVPGRLFGSREAWFDSTDIRMNPMIALPRARQATVGLSGLVVVLAWWLWQRPQKCRSAKPNEGAGTAVPDGSST